jgi:hypothetical protein
LVTGDVSVDVPTAGEYFVSGQVAAQNSDPVNPSAFRCAIQGSSNSPNFDQPLAPAPFQGSPLEATLSVSGTVTSNPGAVTLHCFVRLNTATFVTGEVTAIPVTTG